MALFKTNDVKPAEPSAQRYPTCIASLTVASGPGRAVDLLEHPAFRNVLCPLPMTAQGLEVKALIDRAVEEIATRAPHLVIPGVSVCNRLGDGEKSVIHLPGLQEKHALLWEDIASFREADAQELTEVARCIESRLGVPCDAAAALTVLVERMKALLRESRIYSIEGQSALHLEHKISIRESSLTRKLLKFLPAVKSQDLELKSQAEQTRKLAEHHARPHGENYVACPRRAGVSLLFGRIDSLWYYLPAASPSPKQAGESPIAEPGRYQTQRINTISIALASLGIFQKGVGGWDQEYPSSPFEFWKDHIEPYLGASAQS